MLLERQVRQGRVIVLSFVLVGLLEGKRSINYKCGRYLVTRTFFSVLFVVFLKNYSTQFQGCHNIYI